MMSDDVQRYRAAIKKKLLAAGYGDKPMDDAARAIIESIDDRDVDGVGPKKVYWIYGRSGATYNAGGYSSEECDRVDSYVVVADSEEQVRSLVDGQCGEECGRCFRRKYRPDQLRPEDTCCLWSDPSETVCEVIAEAALGEPRIIVRDFRAG